MSWEEINRKEIKCPCGKGIIIQRTLEDDWNRYRDDLPKIKCIDCAKKYSIEREPHVSKPYRDYTIYYCVEKDNSKNRIQLDL